MYMYDIMDKTLSENYNVVIIILEFILPSWTPHASQSRPHKLWISIEGDGVKGPSAEVQANGTSCDAVEKSLATRMNTNGWLKGGKGENLHGMTGIHVYIYMYMYRKS